MATYPDGIYTGRTMANRPGAVYDAAKTKVIFAEDFNLDRVEITAIQTELGTNPKGSSDSVKDRFDDLEAYILATGGGATTHKFSAYLSADTAIPDVTATVVVCDAENFDPGFDYNAATGEYTVPVSGYYLFIAHVTFVAPVADKTFYLSLQKAGLDLQAVRNNSSITSNLSIIASAIWYCTANEVVRFKVYHNCGVSKNVRGTINATNFQGHLLSV